jgi:hypothetical protein
MVGDARILNALLNEVHVVWNSSEIHSQLVQIDNSVGSTLVAITGLSDTARIDDNPLVEHFRMLDVRVTENEDIFLTEEYWVEGCRDCVPISFIRVVVDDLETTVEELAFSRQF